MNRSYYFSLSKAVLAVVECSMMIQRTVAWLPFVAYTNNNYGLLVQLSCVQVVIVVLTVL